MDSDNMKIQYYLNFGEKVEQQDWNLEAYQPYVEVKAGPDTMLYVAFPKDMPDSEKEKARALAMFMIAAANARGAICRLQNAVTIYEDGTGVKDVRSVISELQKENAELREAAEDAMDNYQDVATKHVPENERLWKVLESIKALAEPRCGKEAEVNTYDRIHGIVERELERRLKDITVDTVTTEDRRITERLQDGQWVHTPLKGLKKGDVFRMFEADQQSPVLDNDGKARFRAVADARPSDRYEGEHEVKSEAYEEEENESETTDTETQ